MSWNDHDHRGEYADVRHDHDGDYAEKYHRHYDLEKEDERLQAALREIGVALSELRGELQAALERIRALEADTPQARQLQLEADQAAADLAESGYDRHCSDCGCSYCHLDPH
jgi:division protein CdvB (Snf7/Vps24/ESCRT-III family)